MKSIIRWAGSKKQIINKLKSYYRADRYIEPFCGSACLFFELEPKEAILNDLNEELIIMYRKIKGDVETVIQCIKRIPVSKKSYYNLREQKPIELSDNERAARFLFLNKYCFNGLYRTNKKGEYNVPFSVHQKYEKIDYKILRQASIVLRNTKLMCGDFANLNNYVKKGDFIYFDPPYYSEENKYFTEYTEGGFSISDLKRLSTILYEFDKKNIKFLVSYADCQEASILKNNNYFCYSITTTRNMNGFNKQNKKGKEILITNIRGIL